MTHIAYCHFHFLSKSFLPFLFIWSIWSPIEKSIQEKTIIPIILKIKKSSKNWEICSVPKNLPGESLFWTLFSTVQENWVWTFRKSQLVYLGKKEREAISAIRITVIQDAENLGIVPILEVTSDKESTTDHELANCSNVLTSQLTKEDKFASRSRSTLLTNLPTLRFDSSLQKRMKQLSKLPVNYTLNVFQKMSNFLWDWLYVCWEVMYNKLCYLSFLPCNFSKSNFY